MADTQHLRNIVLISLDDAVAFWKYRHVFGVELQTPNLDRICAQSTLFESAYCQSPVCSPSRASFMSGKSPHDTGVLGPESNYFQTLPADQLWPAKLKQNGFYTSTGGKVARGYRALPPPLHEVLYSDKRNGLRLPPRLKRRETPNVFWGHKTEFLGGYRGGEVTMTIRGDRSVFDHTVAKAAIKFINHYDQDTRFYRDIGFGATHGPWLTPLKFKEAYDSEKITAPPDWEKGFAEMPQLAKQSVQNIDQQDTDFWQKSVRNYLAAMTYTDFQIGRVWDALKASPHADDTLVVILADHGLHLGERNRFAKRTFYEQVANVPLIIHDPRTPKGLRINDPVGLIDVGHTVMDYLGMPPLDGSAGRSLRPLMKGQSDPDRAVPTFLFNGAGIRYRDYRFIRYGDGTTEFFDLKADWWQTTNLGPDHEGYEATRAVFESCCADYGFYPYAQAAA